MATRALLLTRAAFSVPAARAPARTRSHLTRLRTASYTAS